MKTTFKLTILSMLLAAGVTAEASNPVTPEAKLHPLYKQECSTCHMAYPPDFLSKPAWTRVMTGLANHYGTDASIDEATVRDITKWLHQTGGTYKRVVATSKEDRITTTPWFIKKHREVKPNVFKRTSIKSAANCAACHTKAAEGNFDEDFVRTPK